MWEWSNQKVSISTTLNLPHWKKIAKNWKPHGLAKCLKTMKICNCREVKHLVVCSKIMSKLKNRLKLSTRIGHCYSYSPMIGMSSWYSHVPLVRTRVSFETSFDSKQPKLEPKQVSALSETKRLFRLFRFYTETASFGVSIEPKQTEDQQKQIETNENESNKPRPC